MVRSADYKGDSLDNYLYEISQIPIMPHEQVIELSREYHNPQTSPERKDEIAARLVTSNLRFVVSVAKRYQYHGVPLEDLIEAGNEGLIKASRKYKYEGHKVKFISYAVWWIRQSVLQYLAENSRQTRIPLNIMPKYNRVNKRR